MSTSAQHAAQELRKLLVDLLPDRYRQNYLNSNLARELKSLGFPETPRIFDDAVVFFREFFTEISHPNIMRFGWSRGPIVFGNIFFAIKKFGERLRTFRRILIWTCEQYWQYEALFAVMCEALHHPVDYYDRWNSQNRRDFLLKGMMMVRIEQRRRFPPAPNCKLTHLFHFSLDDILEMMKRKHGMHDHADTRSHMEMSLRIYNSYWNDKYSGPIRRLLQAKPNFFSKWQDQLETFLRKVKIYYKERFWLDLMEDMRPNFWNALNEAGINNEAKSWILYWYLRYCYNLNFEPEDRESFNDLMTRIVQHGEMAFPFKDPPRLVIKGNCWSTYEAALEWESVPTSDLLEICYRSHIKSQYGRVPSQCVLAASVRRKLYEVKIAKAAVKIQKFARRSLWQFYLKRLIAAMIIKQRVLRVVTPILNVKHSKILIISAVKRFFIQKKFFGRLETYRYLEQIKAGCVIFRVLNRLNHVQEYQKIRFCSIIQSRLIALFEKQRVDKIIGQLRAASTFSRFAKVKRAEIVHERLQRIHARSIIQSRLIAIFERRKANEKIKLLKAASALSRFAKVKCAVIVYKRFQYFFEVLSFYECPICLSCFESAKIGMIQPCGHIHCKDCFTKIGKKCSICRAQFMFGNCKSFETFLSQPNSKFFFTNNNPEKKAAVEVITKWWIIKRSLLIETRCASMRMEIARRKLKSQGLAEQ